MDIKIEKDKANCIYRKANFISLGQTEVFSADCQVLTHLFYAAQMYFQFFFTETEV